VNDVRVVFSKWGSLPHWEYDAVRLGHDEHGDWLGAPRGTRLSRPGADFCTEQSFVVLIPRGAWFAASFYEHVASAPSHWVEIYVDITTVAHWRGTTVHLVDLDLDVIKGRTGRVWVDDEDEFAEHRVRFGYPDEMVRSAVASCDDVRAEVESLAPPYDGHTGGYWLAELQAAMMRP
jgi:uncharacterized protein